MDDQVLSLSEAARICGVPRGRLRRHLDGGDFPHAHRTNTTGPWLIPLSDLRALGLTPDPPQPGAAGDTAPATAAPVADEGEPPHGDPVDAGPMVDWLRAEVERWRRRAEVAEAQAHERLARIVDLQRALAAFEAATPGAQPPRPRPPQPNGAPADRILPVPATDPVPLPETLTPRPSPLTRLTRTLRRR